MKRNLILSLCLLLTCAVFAQSQNVEEFTDPFPGGRCYLVRLSLKDKAGSPYSIKHPEKFLSRKAIERRQRQHLPIDETDLPVSPAYLKKLSQAGWLVVSSSKWNNTVVVRTKDSTDVRRMKALPYVTNALILSRTPERIKQQVRWIARDDTTHRSSNPSDVYGAGIRQIQMLNGEVLHRAGYRGRGMTIAVVDGGFMNADTIPLLNNVNIIAHKDMVYPQSANFFGELDHGTMVLSCMAANRRGQFTGTAPDADYVLVRSEYGPTETMAEEDFWAAAVEYADSIGADLINSSLGYHHFDNNLNNHNYSHLDGKTSLCSRSASMLARKGMILVTSAGNEGDEPWKKINVPGDAFDILTVGALSSNGINTNFSSVGPTADGRVKPDVMALGGGSAVISGKGRITQANGTSFSSPIMCGMVACLWQAFPKKTALEIIEMVRRAGNQYDTPDNIFGYGTPDFGKAYEENR